MPLIFLALRINLQENSKPGLQGKTFLLVQGSFHERSQCEIICRGISLLAGKQAGSLSSDSTGGYSYARIQAISTFY